MQQRYSSYLSRQDELGGVLARKAILASLNYIIQSSHPLIMMSDHHRPNLKFAPLLSRSLCLFSFLSTDFFVLFIYHQRLERLPEKTCRTRVTLSPAHSSLSLRFFFLFFLFSLSLFLFLVIRHIVSELIISSIALVQVDMASNTSTYSTTSRKAIAPVNRPSVSPTISCEHPAGCCREAVWTATPTTVWTYPHALCNECYSMMLDSHKNTYKAL